MPYSPVEIHCHFGGIYRLNLQGWRVSLESKHQQQVYLFELLLTPEEGDSTYIWNVGELLDYALSYPRQ
jgi:hypothetical protein